MSEAVLEQTEAKPEDLKAFIDARNKDAQAKKEPAVAGEPVKKPDEPAAEPDDSTHAKPSRRENRLQRAIGREQALREQAEARAADLELRLNGKPKEEPKAEPEPKRGDFPAGEAGTAEFLRAAQKWDKAQDTKTAAAVQAESAGLAENQERWKALDEKTSADIKLIPDWEKVMQASKEDEDAPEIGEGEQLIFMGLLIESDIRAFVAYHFAKHPDELQAILDLSKSPDKQIRAFHRLEGRLEKEYADSKAAQASKAEKPKEDRAHPAEAEKPGGTAAGGQPAKPKPSSEVAARGGSPAPDEPAIGSPAWVLMRNQAQYGR